MPPMGVPPPLPPLHTPSPDPRIGAYDTTFKNFPEISTKKAKMPFFKKIFFQKFSAKFLALVSEVISKFVFLIIRGTGFAYEGAGSY